MSPEFTITEEMKECEDCTQILPISQFRCYGTGGSASRAKCRECEQKYKKNLAQLKKLAPPKPDRCDCLGIVTDKLVMDHDHETNEFRGWISDDANVGIARLGDNKEGVLKALEYLERFEKRNG